MPAAESWSRPPATAVDGASPASPSHIIEHVRAILRTSCSGAWVNSVAGLREPNPSLAQHFRSWIPGGRKGFLAVMHPESLVASLPGRAELPLMPEGVVPATLVLEGELPEAALAALGPIGQLPRRLSPPSDDFGVAWGTSRAVPFVVLPLSLPSLPPSAQPCLVCESLLWSDTCPTCHVRPPELQGVQL